MRAEMDAAFDSRLDLYTTQCLPCTWRHFKRLVRSKDKLSLEQIQSREWRTSHRMCAEHLLARVNASLATLDAALARFDVKKEFAALGEQAQRHFAFTANWARLVDKKMVLALFKSVEKLT